jgi:DNA-damage-inducible protein D
MNNLEINKSIFENIKHIDEDGKEYWYARELQKVLNYTEWRKFKQVINKAKEACIKSLIDTNKQFV